MKKAIQSLFILAITVALSGCLITTRPNRGHGHNKAKRSCHPSQKWNGHRCVHKGKAKGHKKNKKNKHDHRKKNKHDHRR
jgi:hypothetical protein